MKMIYEHFDKDGGASSDTKFCKQKLPTGGGSSVSPAEKTNPFRNCSSPVECCAEGSSVDVPELKGLSIAVPDSGKIESCPEEAECDLKYQVVEKSLKVEVSHDSPTEGDVSISDMEVDFVAEEAIEVAAQVGKVQELVDYRGPLCSFQQNPREQVESSTNVKVEQDHPMVCLQDEPPIGKESSEQNLPNGSSVYPAEKTSPARNCSSPAVECSAESSSVDVPELQGLSIAVPNSGKMESCPEVGDCDLKYLVVEKSLEVEGTHDTATEGDVSMSTNDARASDNIKTVSDMEIDFVVEEAIEVAAQVGNVQELVDNRGPLFSFQQNPRDQVESTTNVKVVQDQPLVGLQDEPPIGKDLSHGALFQKAEGDLVCSKNIEKPGDCVWDQNSIQISETANEKTADNEKVASIEGSSSSMQLQGPMDFDLNVPFGGKNNVDSLTFARQIPKSSGLHSVEPYVEGSSKGDGRVGWDLNHALYYPDESLSTGMVETQFLHQLNVHGSPLPVSSSMLLPARISGMNSSTLPNPHPQQSAHGGGSSQEGFIKLLGTRITVGSINIFRARLSAPAGVISDQGVQMQASPRMPPNMGSAPVPSIINLPYLQLTEAETREQPPIRQLLVPGQAASVEQQTSLASEPTGMGVKRREPDGGHDVYPGGQKRHPPYY